ncbi:protein MIS12 homolog [Ornithorhynchus anatinus]|uniref:Protein MIS12 homolog n=1 Tax=Ornithorhynchus anatinus TaxID=9258 RepID=F7CUW5_ORNAN|nr:protein MIS12 homolog [Ornithorhynchus anatinus]
MSVNPMTYEAQFFGFTPQTCLLRIYVAFQDYLFEVMLTVERVILKRLEAAPGSGVSPVQIRKGTEKFLRFLKERFDGLFGTMETVLLQLVLRVPDHVLLPEDRSHARHPRGPEELARLREEADRLRGRYEAEVRAGRALLAELEEQRAARAELEKTLRWFDGLENAWREHGSGDPRESLAFLIRSSDRLRAVVGDVERKGRRLHLS